MTDASRRDDWIPHGPAPARWIICERTGRWAVALRCRPEAGGRRLYETRTLEDCEAMLAESPASFVVLELAPTNIDAILEWLAARERRYPCVRAAITADRSLREYEPLMLEAGATLFVTSQREPAALAAAARRHLEQVAPPRYHFAQKVWNRLPWG